MKVTLVVIVNNSKRILETKWPTWPKWELLSMTYNRKSHCHIKMIQIEVILNIIYYRVCHMFLRKEIIYMTQIRAPFRDADIYPNGVFLKLLPSTPLLQKKKTVHDPNDSYFQRCIYLYMELLSYITRYRKELSLWTKWELLSELLISTALKEMTT